MNYNYRAYTLLVVLTAAMIIAYLYVPNDLDKLIVMQLITAGILTGRNKC